MRYILVSKGYDTRLNPVDDVRIYDDFDGFRLRVDLILENDNGAESIILAAEIGCE